MGAVVTTSLVLITTLATLWLCTVRPGRPGWRLVETSMLGGAGMPWRARPIGFGWAVLIPCLVVWVLAHGPEIGIALWLGLTMATGGLAVLLTPWMPRLVAACMTGLQALGRRPVPGPEAPVPAAKTAGRAQWITAWLLSPFAATATATAIATFAPIDRVHAIFLGGLPLPIFWAGLVLWALMARRLLWPLATMLAVTGVTGALVWARVIGYL